MGNLANEPASRIIFKRQSTAQASDTIQLGRNNRTYVRELPYLEGQGRLVLNENRTNNFDVSFCELIHVRWEG